MASVGRLIDSGYKVSFGLEKCIIAQDNLRMEGERDGNLYYLRSNRSKERASLGLATHKPTSQTIEVWHRRLGHRTLDLPTIQYLQPRVSDFAISNTTDFKSEPKICVTCAISRQHKKPITGTRNKLVELLGVVHSDICGPMQVSTLSGEKYFITFSDEHSGHIAVTLLKAKSDALSAFLAYRVRAEKEAGKVIKILRTDGGGEYVGQQFKSYLQSTGIVHSVSPP